MTDVSTLHAHGVASSPSNHPKCPCCGQIGSEACDFSVEFPGELRRFYRKVIGFQVHAVPLPHFLIRAFNMPREQFCVE